MPNASKEQKKRLMRWMYSAGGLIEKLAKVEGSAEIKKVEAIWKANLDPVERITPQDIGIQMWGKDGPYGDGTWIEPDLREEMESAHESKPNKPKKKKKKKKKAKKGETVPLAVVDPNEISEGDSVD